MRKRQQKRKRAKLLCVLMAAGMVLVGLSAWVEVKPAQATFPGNNGKIFFDSTRLFGTVNIFAMGADGTMTVVTDTNDTNSKTEPAVSPEGSRIAYVYGGRDIYVTDASGGGAKRITTDANFNRNPAWSPDGKRIVYTSLFNGNDDIFVVNADGTGRTNLTNTAGVSERDPAWSPDGSQIAYTRVGCEGGRGTCVYVMNANGTQQTNLTNEPLLDQCPHQPGYRHLGTSSQPSWSPDSSQIVFTGTVICPNTSGRDIWVMHRDGSAKENLTNDEGTDERQPVFSPDGRQIAFISNQDETRGDILTMNADDGQNKTNRTPDATSNFDEHPDWGPLPKEVSIPHLDFTEETRTGPPGCGYSTNPGQPLRYLSADEHDFFDADGIPDATLDGLTRVYGTITVKGTPGDALKSLELEIAKGNDTIKAALAPSASTALIKPFPSTGVLKIPNRQLLFVLTSAEALKFKPIISTGTNPILTLRVIVTTQNGGTATKTYSYQNPKTGNATTVVHQLVLYDGTNRYPIPRSAKAQNADEGGDGWVLPSLYNAAWILGQVNPGTVWGDFSNMNGSAICPHKTHQEGRDIDGDALPPNAWYDVRNAATATNILAMLKQPTYGTRIEKVFVTYNKPGGTLLKCENGKSDTNHSAFYTAIQNQTVPARGGGFRNATSVIRPVEKHCGHFHIQFFST